MVVAFAPSSDTSVDEPTQHDDGEEGKAETLREATDPFFERHHHSPVQRRGDNSRAIHASERNETRARMSGFGFVCCSLFFKGFNKFVFPSTVSNPSVHS